MRRSPLVLGLVCSLALPGCYTTQAIRPSELAYLDGYDVHREQDVSVCTGRGCLAMQSVPVSTHKLATLDGDAVPFTSQTPLELVSHDGQRQGGRFANIAVRDGVFAGSLLDGTPVGARLDGLDHAEVTRFSPGQTVAAVSLIAVATGVLMALLVVHEVNATRCQGEAMQGGACN